MDNSPRNRKSHGDTTLRQLARRRNEPKLRDSGLLSFFRRKFARQLIASSVLLMMVLLLHLIASPLLQAPRGLIHWVVTNDTDWPAVAMKVRDQLHEIGLLQEVALPSWTDRFAQESAPGEVSMAEAVRPLDGAVTSPFGWRQDEESGKYAFHSGVDLACDLQTPVRAYLGGQVSRVWRDDSYGLAVNVEHDDGVSSLYAHLSEVMVEEGQQVEAGEDIALSGQSGEATGPHLHFELHIDERAIDPEPLLPEEDGQ